VILVDLIERREIRQPKLRLALRDRRRQRRLAVVHVADRPHIYVGLRPLELRLSHDPYPPFWEPTIRRATS
jgi:hypothetical protein